MSTLLSFCKFKFQNDERICLSNCVVRSTKIYKSMLGEHNNAESKCGYCKHTKMNKQPFKISARW